MQVRRGRSPINPKSRGFESPSHQKTTCKTLLFARSLPYVDALGRVWSDSEHWRFMGVRTPARRTQRRTWRSASAPLMRGRRASLQPREALDAAPLRRLAPSAEPRGRRVVVSTGEGLRKEA